MSWNNIIPKPQSVTLTGDTFSAQLPFGIAAENRGIIEALPRINEAAMGITGIDSVFTEGPAPSMIRFVRGKGPERGFYRLQVTSEAIRVEYTDTDAAVNALATITQALLLSEPTPDGIVVLHAASIEDAPALEWRGFMLDTARHFFPMESLHRFLDILWLLRLDRFHLHFTDDQGWRFPVPDYPELTTAGAFRSDMTSEEGRYGDFYRTESLRLLDGQARQLGITLVPEIDLPGHASAALTAYPELACDRHAPGVETRWGIFDHVLCTSHPETYDFIAAVFSSVADTFAGPYIHIGGDEVPEGAWNSCPKCRKRSDPYQTIVRSMADTVIELGRRPMVWDEASRLDLPSSTIVINWRRPADAAAALRHGYDLILAPEGHAAYLDHKHLDSPLEAGRLGVCTVADSAGFSPKTYLSGAYSLASEDGTEAGAGTKAGNTDDAASRQILGGQCNLWTEEIAYHSQAEYMSIVRLAAIADGLWNGVPAGSRMGFFEDLDRFRLRLARRGYTVYTGPFTP